MSAKSQVSVGVWGDWFRWFAAECVLPEDDAQQLDELGFVVIEGPVPAAKWDPLIQAYDEAMRDTLAPDKAVGRTSTRVHDFVNRGAAFDALYVHPPALAAACHTIKQPFKLSNLLGRTLHPHAGAQELHVDFARDQFGWPMLGFILMIDEFRQENGATLFAPGSHKLTSPNPVKSVGMPDLPPACGPAGSVIVYNGSVVHGHGSNQTDHPRRSIQGSYVRRDAAGFDLASRVRPETRERISPLAGYLIGL